MITWHGSHLPELDLGAMISSRYGFTAFFTASNQELARNFAVHSAFKKAGSMVGYIHEVEHEVPELTIIGLMDTYTPEFRHRIIQLHEAGHSSAKFARLADYPDRGFAPVLSDVYVFFNPGCIHSIKRIGEASYSALN